MRTGAIRFKIWLGTMVLGLSLAGYDAGACATCFGVSDSPMAQGMNVGILSLLGVIGFVLLGVSTFFGYLAWRVSRGAGGDPDEGLPVMVETTHAKQ